MDVGRQAADTGTKRSIAEGHVDIYVRVARTGVSRRRGESLTGFRWAMRASSADDTVTHPGKTRYVVYVSLSLFYCLSRTDSMPIEELLSAAFLPFPCFRLPMWISSHQHIVIASPMPRDALNPIELNAPP